MHLEADSLGLVGTVVDRRYRIEAVAGKGGYSVVYRASHIALDVPVALKVLRPAKKANADATGQAEGPGPASSFRTEARVLFRMCALHSSFVQAKDTGLLVTPRGTVTPYLVLEWLAGVSLAQGIRERLGLADMIRLLDAPSRGLAMAHARGIAHRDLKPGNLFSVSCDGVSSVKVLDFGLAKVQSGDAGTTSRFANYEQETRAFTAAYAAPEQWLQRLGATGTWTDVYAWALLCGELLSGQAPVRGNCEQQLMAACLDASHRPTPRALGAEVPVEVERVFARALSIDPRERFRQIGHFWDALCLAASSNGVAVLASIAGGVSATSIPNFEQSPPVVASVEPPTEDDRQDAAWAIRSRSSSSPRRSPAKLANFLAVAAALLFSRSQSWREVTAPTLVAAQRSGLSHPVQAEVKQARSPELDQVFSVPSWSTSVPPAPTVERHSNRRRGARSIHAAAPSRPLQGNGTAIMRESAVSMDQATPTTGQPAPESASSAKDLINHHELSSRR